MGSGFQQPQLPQQSQDEDLGDHRRGAHDAGRLRQGLQRPVLQTEDRLLLRVRAAAALPGPALRLHGLPHHLQVAQAVAPLRL